MWRTPPWALFSECCDEPAKLAINPLPAIDRRSTRDHGPSMGSTDLCDESTVLGVTVGLRANASSMFTSNRNGETDALTAGEPN